MSSGQMVAYVFEKKFPVRSIDRDGEPWFVARDVCEALGKKWDGHSLDSIQTDWRGVEQFTTPIENQHGVYGEMGQDVVIINEAAVFKLAFRSKKKAAVRFTDWVANEVLPSIRKTGRYEAPGAEGSQMDPKLAMMAAKAAIVREVRHSYSVSAALRTMANLGLLEDLGLTCLVEDDAGGLNKAGVKSQRHNRRARHENIGIDALARIFDASFGQEPVAKIFSRAIDGDADASALLKKLGVRVEPDGSLLFATNEKLWVGRLFRRETPGHVARLLHIPSALRTAPKRFANRAQHRCVRVPATAAAEILNSARGRGV